LVELGLVNHPTQETSERVLPTGTMCKINLNNSQGNDYGNACWIRKMSFWQDFQIGMNYNLPAE
jgi:hypothetical protein